MRAAGPPAWIVVSHNQLASLEGVSVLTGLSTLAVAHNQLRELPSLGFATNLEQLRLNDNKLLALGTALATNARCARGVGRGSRRPAGLTAAARDGPPPSPA